MRIPLSQLRFSTASSQVWGINFFRRIQRKAEQVVFAYSQSERSRVRVVLRASLRHRATARRRGGSRSRPMRRRARSASTRAARTIRSTTGRARSRGAGLDAKYGLTSGLTLDATINPDFGQVDADPAFVNLSAFEQFLNERRPFFVEGANIFNFNANAQLFYSRRIGRAPQGVGRRSRRLRRQPDHATIAGAGKLSGRVGEWSLGVLEATTARAFATVDSSGARFKDRGRAADELFRRAAANAIGAAAPTNSASSPRR